MLALGLLAPLVIEPIFNRFTRFDDGELATELRALAERAQLPIKEVLVADASRRTRKANAYVSGLGPTRRLVLFDTLLAQAAPAEIGLVVAHELGHRRAHHLIKGALLSMVGLAGFVLVLWTLLRWPDLRTAIGAPGSAGDPRVVPFVLLLAAALEIPAAPLGSALSRRWEREADRFSLGLTHDLAAFEATNRSLATANLSDLDPPRPIDLMLFEPPHPGRADPGRSSPGAPAGATVDLDPLRRPLRYRSSKPVGDWCGRNSTRLGVGVVRCALASCVGQRRTS